MNNRNMPYSKTPSRNQSVSITLKNGRKYGICSEGQYRYLISQARAMITGEMMDEGKKPTADEIEARLQTWIDEKCQFATMAVVLAKMTPEEKALYEDKYRFSGITRRPK